LRKSSMPIEKYDFYSTEHGWAAVALFRQDSGWECKTFPKVKHFRTWRLAKAFCLDDEQRLQLLRGLSDCIAIYSLGEATSQSSDVAVANWLSRSFGKNLKRLKSLHANNTDLKEQAVRFMAKILAEKCEGEIANNTLEREKLYARHGIEVIYSGGELYSGSAEIAIERWLEMASILSDIEMITRAKLQSRSWSGNLLESPSSEAQIYGYSLPQLYSKTMGKLFESRRSDGEVKVNRGHVFTIHAALCLGFQRVSVSNIHSHFSKQIQ
jgi:hypothetical protein